MNTKFQAARIKTLVEQPFFGSLMCGLEIVEDRSQPTAWVDGTRLGYNPDFFEGLTTAEAEFVVCHEILHVALGHHIRIEGRDPGQWNDATDYVINGDLVQMGMTPPIGVLLDKKYTGKTAEVVYSMLEKDRPQGSKPQQGQGNSATGHVRPAPQQSEAEKVEAEANMREQVAVASQMARAAGSLPGSIERLLKSKLQPKVDWREALHRWFASQAQEDYSWNKRSRRSSAEMILPGRFSEAAAGTFAVAIDVSGSITSRVLEKFGAELQALKDSVHPERLLLLYFDSGVRKVEDLGPDDLVNLRAVGGGGTDFHAAPKWLEAQGIEPAALVYLTDMYGSIPPEPSYPVLWVSTTGDRNTPYGEVVELS